MGTSVALMLGLAAVQACTSAGTDDPTSAANGGTNEVAPAPASASAASDASDASPTLNGEASASPRPGERQDGGSADVGPADDGSTDAGAADGPSGTDGGSANGSTFNGTCAGFTTTVVQQLDWSAAGNLRLDTYNAGRLGDDGVLVASFTTGSNPGYPGATVRVGYVYWPADQELNGKTMVVSKDAPACDLVYSAGWGRSGSSTSSLPLAYDDDSPYGYQRLDPNTTYYVTIANRVGGVNTCTTGKCEFRLEISRSGGI